MASEKAYFKTHEKIDAIAFGYELGDIRGWKKARDLVKKREGGGELWIYDLIDAASLAFTKAAYLQDQHLKREHGPDAELWEAHIWDDDVIFYAERIVKYIIANHGDVPSDAEFEEMANAQLMR